MTSPNIEISKLATRRDRFRIDASPGVWLRGRTLIRFSSARAGFKAYLLALGLRPGDRILLPAYIGWSHREGSGVFDPVREMGLEPVFYDVDERLRIAIDEATARIAGVRAAVIIHYFGFPDPAFARLASVARAHGVPLVEDSAHAMFTDLASGTVGGEGDTSLWSLHKLLPVPHGGILAVNPACGPSLRSTLVAAASSPVEDAYDLETYDIAAIAERRRANARRLASGLGRFGERVTLLWPDADLSHVVPQTLPVLIHAQSRDKVYFAMNELGFGVVSLYHTLVDAIPRSSFPRPHAVAAKVLNLPVHQDATPDDMDRMLDALERVIERSA